jgi:hypothetical protein
MVTILVFGALGGAARGLVGFMKHFQAYKEVKFRWQYFGMSVVISAAVGLAVVWAIDSSGIKLVDAIGINPGLALIIGYAGGDAVENLYKIVFNKPLLSTFGDLVKK